MATKSVPIATGSRDGATNNDVELQTLESTAAGPGHHSDSADETSDMTRKNIFKIVVAGFSFFFAGTNDGSLGALIPYILRTYNVGTQYVALMYGCIFALYCPD
jgi:hypothetical protein